MTDDARRRLSRSVARSLLTPGAAGPPDAGFISVITQTAVTANGMPLATVGSMCQMINSVSGVPYVLPIGSAAARAGVKVDGQALVRVGDQIPSGPGVLMILGPPAAPYVIDGERRDGRTASTLDAWRGSARTSSSTTPAAAGSSRTPTWPPRSRQAGPRRAIVDDVAASSDRAAARQPAEDPQGRARAARPRRLRLAPPRADRRAERRAHAQPDQALRARGAARTSRASSGCSRVDVRRRPRSAARDRAHQHRRCG